MKKLLAIGLLFGSVVAFAQPAADLKKETATCEKGKQLLADHKAKNKCTGEADEAAKVTCSAATSKQVSDLLAKCTAAKPADKPAAGSAAPAEPAAVPKCRAIDPDGKTVVEEAENKLATKCSTLLLDKLKKKWCTAENKGKQFDYTLSSDHMIGKGALAKKMEDSKRTWTCRTVVK